MVRIFSQTQGGFVPPFTTRGLLMASCAAAMLSAPGVSNAQSITATDLETGDYWNIPWELNAENGGPSQATLEEAAYFAWLEFIALNWPAKEGMRGVPDTKKRLGDAGPVVWETMASKVEIFPGTAILAPADYTYPYKNYNSAPQYIYNPSEVGTPDGTVKACGSGKTGNVPYINLDETTQIGLDNMFAGVGEDGQKQIRFLAKANEVEHKYVMGNSWYGSSGGSESAANFLPPTSATASYISENNESPPAGSSEYVSFPSGTIELKSAWRKLSADDKHGEFYTAPVRFYEAVSSTDKTPCYIDSAPDEWGMLALHIIHKTPGAPYFIFATFEQKDNIRTPDGHSVELANGLLTADGKKISEPLSPNIQSVNSQPISTSGGQKLTVQTFTNTEPPTTQPKSQLYYQNIPGAGLPDAKYIGVNKRKHDIPDVIAVVNQAFQSSIAVLAKGAVFSNYKLVNVQWVPVDKVAGETYTSQTVPQLQTPAGQIISPATYYQANSVVETDYNLQVFSGQFYSGNDKGFANTITDFTQDGNKFHNVKYDGNGYLMGGCMGCHGNAQIGGSDFSFILEGNPDKPDIIGGPEIEKAIADHFQNILRGQN